MNKIEFIDLNEKYHQMIQMYALQGILCYKISTCIAFYGYKFKLNTAKRLLPHL
jgi:hypothetical protein